MSYEQIKDLEPALFKRYCGVKPETFRRMIKVVTDHLAETRIKSGRPPKLSVEDQVLMTLEYWREYRTFFHLARSWGVHESSVLAHDPTSGRFIDHIESFHLAR
jgi:hypothetical protein